MAQRGERSYTSKLYNVSCGDSSTYDRTKNICNIKTTRGMMESFNKEECIENVTKVLGLETLEELPHYDTTWIPVYP